MSASPVPWPYPRWIAHRGAGKLAPENTLAALRLGASYGYRMFECDVKLSADGVPFLLHDATLKRTIRGLNEIGASQGRESIASEFLADQVAGHHDWSVLSRLDAGRWHSRDYAGEPIPSLQAVAAYCLANHYLLNIEIKPTPGTEEITGVVVAQEAARLWAGQATPPLLTSFQPVTLESAQHSAPELPRGLLLDTLWTGWLDTALRLRCMAVVCNHALWDHGTVFQAKAAGLRTLSYTVNDERIAQRLIELGTDGIITDRIDLFAPGP